MPPLPRRDRLHLLSSPICLSPRKTKSNASNSNCIGRPWTALDRDFWFEHWPSFGTLLPASYRYYLPSLLMLSLDEPPDARELVSGTLVILTPSFRRLHDYGRDKRFEYQTSLFSRDQQAVVCSFLGWLLAYLVLYRA